MTDFFNAKIHSDGPDVMVVEIGGTVQVKDDGGLSNDHIVRNLRTRVATADVNAGKALLPAIPGFKYRIVDVGMIAIGGNAATATSVDIVTTQGASSVRPLVVAVAALTRSALVKPSSANVTLLADGASFVANDANTGVYISKQAAGSDLATATAVDVSLSYTIEAA